MRLGAGARGVTEVMALADHVAGLAAGAAGLRLAADIPSRAPGTEEPPRPEPDRSAAAETLEQIRAVSAESLGVDRVPDFWLILARQPRLLAAMWDKHRLVMSAGRLPEHTKHCVALAVATFRQSDYWISYFSELARRSAAVDDESLVELVGCVMHYVAFNTVAHGMLLEPPYSEMVASDFEP
jgi:alkylhydroperoxidase/carboxymuconolactone decarboxylase family protein YurZ